jgi:hypothetical protein
VTMAILSDSLSIPKTSLVHDNSCCPLSLLAQTIYGHRIKFFLGVAVL